jgi:hypothetical protein
MARLSYDLLAQAQILARREPRRPKQATLRRSISTCYYAIFHFLIEEATFLLVGAGHGDSQLRQFAARSFVHGKMKSLCKEFVKGNAQSIHELLRPFWTPMSVANATGMRLVAQTFIDLQDARHDADYNVSVTFSRHEALNAVARAENAFNAWRRLRSSNRELCRFFAIALSLWPSLSSR